MDNITLLSKAATAFVTSLIMIRLKSWLGIDDLGLSAQLQTVVSLVDDTVISAVVGYLTWMIPLGEKYVHDKMIGKTVIISVPSPVVGQPPVTSVGTVKSVVQ